jgi:predicted HD phosphohydrolase
MERPSSPSPRPNATILSAQALRGGGTQGIGSTVIGGRHAEVGENGAVIQVPSLSIDDIGRLLGDGATRLVEVGDESGRTLRHTHLQHALQVAAVLRAAAPDDDELAVAGLVHDIGHLLEGVGDPEHAEAGAAAVAAALGERVAGLVGLHVEAKRYLVASEGDYAGELSDDSMASLGRQGGPMTADERAAFAQLALGADAVRLRRADEGGKVPGLEVGELDGWMEVVRHVYRRVSS